jgi:BASS family bile acid:Na+ symporter
MFSISLFADQFLPMYAKAMILSIIKILMLPITAGLLFNHFLHGCFSIVDRAIPKLSRVGIAIIITVFTAAGCDSLLDIGAVLVVLVLVQNILGYVLGYDTTKLFAMDEALSCTIAFKVGLQTLGSHQVLP